MKKSKDGINILDRVYYYILDFNDRDNFNYIRNIILKERLADCTAEEFKKLFIYATEHDLKNITN